MSSYYVYPLSRARFRVFKEDFPNYKQRNDDFIIVKHRYCGWLDPPDMENRRRMTLTINSHNDEIFILARSGRGDWDFAQWLSANDITMPPPIQIYSW